MKYKQQQELVIGLRELADFYENPESIILPKPYIYISENVNEGEYKDVPLEDGESTEYKFVQDFDASKSLFKKFVSVLGSCEKKWGSHELRVIKKFGFGSITLAFTVSREVVCRKVVTGITKVKKTAYVEIPNEYVEVEEIEWVCDDVALLS